MASEKLKVTIYTDGACSGNPGPGAWAAVLMFGNHKKEITGYEENTTNNRMELTAALEALRALTRPCEVDLYSDSAYLVSAFNQGWLDKWQQNSWKNAAGQAVSNKDLWQSLIKLSKKHQVRWHKVKGHADNQYNNRCDELAVELIKKQRGTVIGEIVSADQRSMQETKSVGSVSLTAQDSQKLQAQEFKLAEKIVSDKLVYDGKLLKLHKREVTFPSGESSSREVIEHPGGAAVVALNSNHEVIMVKQFRSAARQVLLEIPAGLLEPGEDPLTAAQREFAEETGYRAQTWTKICEAFVSPGYTSEKVQLFFARNLCPGERHLDPHEYINLQKIPLEEALAMIANGQIIDAKSILGLLWLEQHLRGESKERDE